MEKKIKMKSHFLSIIKIYIYINKNLWTTMITIVLSVNVCINSFSNGSQISDFTDLNRLFGKKI